MKHVALSLAATLLMGVATLFGQEFAINHGPYLQNLDQQGVSIYFSTSHNAFSQVELRECGADTTTLHYTSINGLKQANNTKNQIRINGLKADTEYDYRIVSQQITTFEPYNVVFGDTIRTKWERFRTLSPSTKSWKFAMFNDIHNNNEKLRTLAQHIPLEEATMVFCVGDMMNYFHKPDLPYEAFIDTLVELFARNIPFVTVRGNHETRGALARSFGDYVERPNGEYYHAYYVGDTAVVMFDTGEDKRDNATVYAGLVDFSNYRREQAEWFAREIATPRFQSAKHRIVLMHIAPLQEGEQYSHRSAGEIDELFTPLFNQAGIDLVLSGHFHRQHFEPTTQTHNHYPIFINDHNSAVWVEIDEQGIDVSAYNTKGEKNFELYIAN